MAVGTSGQGNYWSFTKEEGGKGGEAPGRASPARGAWPAQPSPESRKSGLGEGWLGVGGSGFSGRNRTSMLEQLVCLQSIW